MGKGGGMARLTPDDAFGLALIAKDPKSNKDLVGSLSNDAQPIGNKLVEPAAEVDPEIAQAAETLRRWATSKIAK
jgi:hypothetical protein